MLVNLLGVAAEGELIGGIRIVIGIVARYLAQRGVALHAHEVLECVGK